MTVMVYVVRRYDCVTRGVGPLTLSHTRSLPLSYHPSVCPSICLSVCLSVYPFCPKFSFWFSAEFATYLDSCRSLPFQDKPDYDYLRQIFRDLFHSVGYTNDSEVDWKLLKLV